MAQTVTIQQSRSRFRPGNIAFRIVGLLLAITAWGIYLSIIPAQAQLWWGYGLFFVLAAVATGMLGVSLLFSFPTRRVALVSIAALTLLVLTWIVTRVGGFPGIYTFIPLPFGVLDSVATVAELLLIAMLAGVLIAHRK